MDSTPQAVQSALIVAPQGQIKSSGGKSALGGVPTPTVDVPILVVFLILFILGAFTHISIYRANAKRGHKFLISDLIFDFCLVRVVTCIIRIIWAFVRAPGVALAANLFQNGGAVVLFAVNLFFAQRLVRAMHPSVGWRPLFGRFSLLLIFSVPAVTVMNIITGIVSFFSADKPVQLEATENVLIFGASWNMMLAVMPLLWMFLSNAKPGPPTENFGIGDFRAKATLLVFSASTLAVGAAIRLTALAHPESPETTSPVFSKETFYTTEFFLELLTVASYAFFRVDLTYHVPNGAQGPGDYARAWSMESRSWTLHDIEVELRKIGVRYEILRSRGRSKEGPLFVMLYPTSAPQPEKDLPAVPQEYNDGVLPPRHISRVSRRQSLMEAIGPSRPPRSMRTTMYLTSDTSPGGGLQTFRSDESNRSSNLKSSR